MKILLATDGSSNALRATDYVTKLAEDGIILQISVLTVVTLTLEIALVDGLNKEEYYKLVEIRANSVFKKHKEKLDHYKQLKVEYIVKQGDIAQEIVDFSEKEQHDQIVIGSRGLSNIKELFLGSVSHKVIQIAKCPIVIVK